MLYVLGIILVLAIIFGPQLWVQYAIRRHAVPRSDLPGTGSELAEHLIEHFELNGVGVARTALGDHYDPQTRTVHLKDENYDGVSLSAVAIATHEVGHAIQHMRGERLLSLRQRLATFMMWTDRIGSIFLFLAPILAGASRVPGLFFASLAVGFIMMGMRVVVHAITLPVEFDASFKKALPILEQGNYLHPNDLPAVRQVLRAAALTYVAGALMSLLNLARWIRVLR